MTHEVNVPGGKPAAAAIDLDDAFAQRLVLAIATVLIVVRAQGDVMVWNAAAEQVLGWPSQDVIGRPLADLRLGDLDGLVRRLAAADADTHAMRDEVLVRSADGRQVAMIAHLSRVMPGEEGAGAVVIALEDITGRLEEEQRLRSTRDRLQLLVQYAADMVVLVDTDGTTLFVSSAIAERAGLDVEEMQGRNAFELVHPDDEPRARAALASVTGEHTSCTLIFRLRARAGDYIWMEGRAVNLLDQPSVLAILVSLHDVTERVAIESELAHQATHDPLTGLPNRTLFIDRLDHQVEHARRHDLTVAVFFWDIDQFKSVNDVAGHVVGDQVLIEVAERAARAVRTEDTVARLGGDEFVACAEVDTDAQALALAERLLEALAIEITLEGGRGMLVTPSIGLAYGAGARADRLLVEADRAMYDAKRMGGRAVAAARVAAD